MTIDAYRVLDLENEQIRERFLRICREFVHLRQKAKADFRPGALDRAVANHLVRCGFDVVVWGESRWRVQDVALAKQSRCSSELDPDSADVLRKGSRVHRLHPDA